MLNAQKRHTGRDEVEIRYPVDYRFFLDSGHPPSADSGMTELATRTKNVESFISPSGPSA